MITETDPITLGISVEYWLLSYFDSFNAHAQDR